MKSIHDASGPPSLDHRDRRLLLICVGIVVLLAVIVTLIAPREDDDDPVPSSYSSASHGSEAGYLALEKSGYQIERWEQPLGNLAEESNNHTVLIVAEPFPLEVLNAKPAIQKILDRGGRVIATGIAGATLLPNGHAEPTLKNDSEICAAQPQNSDSSGEDAIEIRPSARWAASLPGLHIGYACQSDPVIVGYPVGKGTAIWWANSMPLENREIADHGDLSLLLQSLGSDPNARVVWDESLHADTRSIWSYANGTPVKMLWAQLLLVGIFLILSKSRRSGPLLPDPVVARDTQLEFVRSLGALYDKANATDTAVKIAYARFRLLLGHQVVGIESTHATDKADEMVSVVRARVGREIAGLHEKIVECEEIRYAAEPIGMRNALTLVQTLWDIEDEVGRGGKTKS
jgi:hypothetical protein